MLYSGGSVFAPVLMDRHGSGLQPEPRRMPLMSSCSSCVADVVPGIVMVLYNVQLGKRNASAWHWCGAGMHDLIAKASDRGHAGGSSRAIVWPWVDAIMSVLAY